MPDPERLCAVNGEDEWAAWTWEVRFGTGPKVTDAIRWSADPTHLREISRFLADANPSPEVEAAFEELFSKLETPSGRANFCEGSGTMGAPNLSLAEIPAADLEFAGLNGRPSVDCGFILPVIRHKPTNRFALVGRFGTPLRWDTQEVIDEFEKLGRLTRLETPFPLPGETGADIYDDPDDQPIIGWATKRFLVVTDISALPTGLVLPSGMSRYGFGGQHLVFSHGEPKLQTLRLHADKRVVHSWVWLGESKGIMSKFDDWANTLIGKFDAGLTAERPAWEELERVADFGLCAARAPAVRYALFVRYCAAMYFRPDVPPERASTQYRVFVRNEFKTVSWDRFRADMLFVLTRSRDRLEFDQRQSSADESEPLTATAGQFAEVGVGG